MQLDTYTCWLLTLNDQGNGQVKNPGMPMCVLGQLPLPPQRTSGLVMSAALRGLCRCKTPSLNPPGQNRIKLYLTCSKNCAPFSPAGARSYVQIVHVHNAASHWLLTSVASAIIQRSLAPTAPEETMLTKHVAVGGRSLKESANRQVFRYWLVKSRA
jgi:hypothetical protein